MLNPLLIYLIALQQHKAHYPYNNITLPHTAHGKNYIRGTHVLTHKLNPSTGSHAKFWGKANLIHIVRKTYARQHYEH